MNDGAASMEKLKPPLPPVAKQLMNTLNRGRILRYRIDICSVAAVIAAVSVQFLAYWFQWPWYSLGLVLLLMRPAHLAEHNHSHLTLFKSYVLNEGIGWLMFLNSGIPLQFYREVHVRVHHHGLGTSKDWTSPWFHQGTSFTDKPVSRIYYYLTFVPASILECAVIFARKPLSRSTFNLVLSLIVVGAATTAFATHDIYNFLLFYVVPWIVTYVYLAKANWSHHENCELSSVFTTSNNDLNLGSRKWGFNIGYHTAHHWYPTLHWSLLQEFHDTHVAAHLPKSYYTPIAFRRLPA
jgi:fatty acid desaturase